MQYLEVVTWSRVRFGMDLEVGLLVRAASYQEARVLSGSMIRSRSHPGQWQDLEWNGRL